MRSRNEILKITFREKRCREKKIRNENAQNTNSEVMRKTRTLTKRVERELETKTPETRTRNLNWLTTGIRNENNRYADSTMDQKRKKNKNINGKKLHKRQNP